MTQPSIKDYAFLSDCNTAALVSRDGSIDWYCPRRFDAPSVFSYLLDDAAGHWFIRPTEQYTVERTYIDNTLVLRTLFHTSSGTVSLTDALAFGDGERGHEIGMNVPHRLLRRVEGIAGSVDMTFECEPLFEYALARPHIELTKQGSRISGGPTTLYLQASHQLEASEGMLRARFSIRAGDSAEFALSYGPQYQSTSNTKNSVDVAAALDNTIAGWRSWSDEHQSYTGLYAEHVHRSAFVLQGLTFQPSGAMVAAPTTSLPEQLGGDANWDYRYAWLRDWSLIMRALWIAACPDEGERSFRWLTQAIGDDASTDRNIQIVFGVEGERDLTERSMEHLRGYQASTPVRVGNDAWHQKQLDVLGEVVEAVYLFRETIEIFDGRLIKLVIALADRAMQHWQEADAGMWEARDKERHYLSSKVMCWVALDRAIKLAPQLGAEAKTAEWEKARDEMYDKIVSEGWSKSAGAYTGAFGSNHLDASALIMPLVGFLPATDARMRATIDTVIHTLAKDGAVHRWKGDQNGFVLCSYWLVECLALAGEWDRARTLFEQTTAYANDLGLLAEMVDARTGIQIGNYPQAFSHVGLINAAWRLDQTKPAAIEAPQRVSL